MPAGPTTMPALEADGTTIRNLLGTQNGSNQFSAGAMLVHPTTGAPLIGQATKANGIPVAFASDQVGTAGTPSSDVLTVQGVSGGAAVPVTPQATESHLGEVGGNSASLALTFTVSTTPAYASGDVIGGLVTISNALRASGKNALLQDLYLFDNANQKPAGSLLFFNANPTAATTTDNAAFAYSTDTGKQIGRVDIAASDWTTIASKASLHIKNIGALLSAASGTTLYAVFVTTSTPTFAATTDLSGAIGLLRD